MSEAHTTFQPEPPAPFHGGAYFTLLRPGRTLLVTLFVGLIAATQLHGVLCGQAPEAVHLLVVAAVGPLAFGALLFGPLREAMSRSFFPTLPEARRSLRRWHIATVTAAALLFLLAASLAAPDFPRAAILGLILAGLTLPLFNDSRSLSVGAVWMRVLTFAAVSAVLVLSTRPLAAAIGFSSQWAILAAGFACAVLGFRHGFAATRGNERQPCFCLQSQLPIPGSGFAEIMRQAQADKARFAARRTDRPTRAWTVTAVGSSVRAWVAVLHHARFGGGSRFGSLSGHAAAGFLSTIVCPVSIFLISHRDFGNWSTYVKWCREIAEAARFDPTGKPPSSDSSLGLVAIGILILMNASGTTAITTKLFPLSRRRLASGVFIETVRLSAVAWFGYSLALFGGVALASRVAGLPLTLGSFAEPLRATLLTAPMLLGALTFLFLVARWLGLFGLLVTWVAFTLVYNYVAAAVSSFSVSTRFLQLSPLAWLAITGATAWLCWRAVQRHFRRCDLTRPPAWAKLLSTGL